MAKDKPKPAPPSSSATTPVPYPKTWGKMKPEERQRWLKEHRPNRPAGQVARAALPPAPPPAPVAATAPVPAPLVESGRPLVQIDVEGYSVRVGTREPVSCDPGALMDTVDAELDAWEDQCQREGTTTEGGETEADYPG